MLHHHFIFSLVEMPSICFQSRYRIFCSCLRYQEVIRVPFKILHLVIKIELG